MQRPHDFRIGGGKLKLAHFLAVQPHKWVAWCLGMTGEGGSTFKKVELDRTVFVVVVGSRELSDNVNGDTGLFEAFSYGAFGWSLSTLNFSTRKLPESCQGGMSGSPANQNFVVPLDDGDGHHRHLCFRVVHSVRSDLLGFQLIHPAPGRTHHVVAGVDVDNFARDAGGHIGQQKSPAAADFFVGHIAFQWRHTFV